VRRPPVRPQGGVKFFNLAVESAEGDFELLEAVMAGANAEVDESAEERKGGAGDIGARQQQHPSRA
jgi:hypothetical protein